MYHSDMKIPDVLGDCRNIEQWRARREEYLEKLALLEYGKRPELEYRVTWKECARENVEELNAVHIRILLTVETGLGAHTFPVTAFLPVREERVPGAVLICSQSRQPRAQALPAGLVEKGNEESGAAFMGLLKRMGVVMETPEDLSGMMPALPVPLDLDRDYDRGHWPVREMMRQGLAMIGFYASDAEPDDQERFPEGLAKIFGTPKERAEHDWGLLAVWAFAAGCVMDWAVTLPELDASRIAVTGHSRCGKAALWCGANDERFGAVMPNGSGCCGAAVSRGKTGENIACIQQFFPHWFAPAFKKYAGRERELPFDQHFLLAAVAPRILHVGSGSQDAWADPEGERCGAYLAGSVWRLYGEEGLPERGPSENEMQTAGTLGYHLRRGPHLLDTFDWLCLWKHMSECMIK